ncbi:MAG TPA: FeoA family protein [Clostridia bacterium]|nr:FeoA family protein [Clostridia bacterium]
MLFKCRRCRKGRSDVSELHPKCNPCDATQMNAAQMKNGESAEVVKIHHNNKIISKLEAMGVIPGAVITKKSAILAGGPVIIEKGLMQFAIGHNIAQKIIVKPVDMERGRGV